MALKDKLNGDSSNRKPKKQKLTHKHKSKSKSTISSAQMSNLKSADILKNVEQIINAEAINKINRSEIPVQKIGEHLYHHIGEWLRSYALVGFTESGHPVEIIYNPTPMDDHALDGLIFKLSAIRTAMNNIAATSDVKRFIKFNNEEDEY